jgi:hypothetical protein
MFRDQKAATSDKFWLETNFTFSIQEMRSLSLGYFGTDKMANHVLWSREKSLTPGRNRNLGIIQPIAYHNTDCV